MSRSELTAIIDFILNKADEAEFEVIRKACDRRMKDGGAFAALGASSSRVLAKNMADQVESMMGVTKEGVRGTMRNLVEGIVRKNEPNIGAEQLGRLLDQVLPPEDAQRQEEGPSPLPPDMLLSMARDFVSYSEGTMPPSKQKELWDWMPRWQDEYWKALPSNIKSIIKAYLEGRIDAETFTTALLSILGI